MDQTFFAQWLDQTFFPFDNAILSFFHHAAEWGGVVLTPLMKFISLLGEKGALFILIALALMLFKNTRKNGVCMLGALCFGVLLTNIILKNAICRMRPFEAYEIFSSFWEFIGAPHAGGHSFPSGHTTATAAAMAALTITFGKKMLPVAIPSVLLMGASRNYLMVHYPTDVIAAIFVGVISALLAYGVTVCIFRVLTRYQHLKFFQFILNFDLKNAILHIRTSEKKECL